MPLRKVHIVPIVLLALVGVSCRTSHSTRSKAARNNQPPPASAAPSAQTVLTQADSALDRVSQLSQEDQETAPHAEQPSEPNFSQQRTPWGEQYIPQPNTGDYGVYEAALGSYNGKRYDEAIALFSQIVTRGKPPELVPNAYYWMGESLYAENRYAESVPYFQYVLRVGPEYKREMALFKLSRGAVHLENKQDADLYYERLRSEYPRSHYIATLRKLGAR